jgi:hypothetical protein
MMKQNMEAVKFDIETKREGCFTCLTIAGLVIGFIIIMFNSGGKHGSPPPNYEMMKAGAFILVSSLIVFGIMRLFTDDYLMIDPYTEHIMSVETFFFRKTTTLLCPFKDVKYIKLETNEIVGKSSHTEFYLNLFIKDDIKKSVDSVSMPLKTGCQFDPDVAELRNKAVQIASITECQVVYGYKIPLKERLQPKNVKVIPEKEDNHKAPLPVKNLSYNMESDFIDEGKEKICPSCGGKIPAQNKYCNGCGKEL